MTWKRKKVEPRTYYTEIPRLVCQECVSFIACSFRLLRGLAILNLFFAPLLVFLRNPPAKHQLLQNEDTEGRIDRHVTIVVFIVSQMSFEITRQRLPCGVLRYFEPIIENLPYLERRLETKTKKNVTEEVYPRMVQDKKERLVRIANFDFSKILANLDPSPLKSMARFQNHVCVGSRNQRFSLEETCVCLIETQTSSDCNNKNNF